MIMLKSPSWGELPDYNEGVDLAAVGEKVKSRLSTTLSKQEWSKWRRIIRADEPGLMGILRPSAKWHQRERSDETPRVLAFKSPDGSISPGRAQFSLSLSEHVSIETTGVRRIPNTDTTLRKFVIDAMYHDYLRPEEAEHSEIQWVPRVNQSRHSLIYNHVGKLVSATGAYQPDYLKTLEEGMVLFSYEGDQTDPSPALHVLRAVEEVLDMGYGITTRLRGA
jgi:hypothetical protein